MFEQLASHPLPATSEFLGSFQGHQDPVISEVDEGREGCCAGKAVWEIAETHAFTVKLARLQFRARQVLGPRMIPPSGPWQHVCGHMCLKILQK